MKRFPVMLALPIYRWLKKKSTKMGISMAELVRRILHEALENDG